MNVPGMAAPKGLHDCTPRQFVAICVDRRQEIEPGCLGISHMQSVSSLRSFMVQMLSMKCTGAGFQSRCRAMRPRAAGLRVHAASSVAQTHQAPPPADRRFDDYQPRTAILFPGQGAQSVGMAGELAKAIPAAAALFDAASDQLGYDLLRVCVEGPKARLDSTAVSQPAIYVASLAAVEKLRAEGGEEALAAIDVAAGLSLGEYTALAFAGAFSFADGLRLVALRGASMQAAADAAPSGMVSVIGLPSDAVAALCEAANAQVAPDQAVRIANYLCDGNYAVSGGLEGCAAVEGLAKAHKARMTVRLAVAGAFHTPFMQPAVEALSAALADTPLVAPRIPVVSNVDAAPHSDPGTIRTLLARQVTSPVQWEGTLGALLGRGLERSYEVGPGKVIAGIFKRVDRKHPVVNVTA
ncbi:MCT1 [Auxenochlorella protothecoides x Auxenochlorella symbiontica]|uniref:Malonyl-CoA:ACP transacylase (MAT) domain-containing protein n=1 Tax=Auxenochlorella protothecoides TaxID=3075 RepID=A0A1D1ZSI2_AUXPR